MVRPAASVCETSGATRLISDGLVRRRSRRRADRRQQHDPHTVGARSRATGRDLAQPLAKPTRIPLSRCPMSVSTTIDHEPSLFDPKPQAERVRQPEVAAQPELAAATQAVRADETVAHVDDSVAGDDASVQGQAAQNLEDMDDTEDLAASSGEEQGKLAEADSSAESDGSPRTDRKRLAEQLDALRRKEAELLRALAITDHPALADAIRTIEARVYCVSRADAKLAQGLSKGEARRQETISKKLTSLRDKRAELDTQIAALESELEELGAARMAEFEQERQQALQDLMLALAQHDTSLRAAGLEVQALLPEIGNLMPELEAVARMVSGREPRA